MDPRPFISKNSSNEALGNNSNQQKMISTSNPLINQNNNQIQTTELNIGQPTQNDFSRITNMNQINHLRINQLNDNTFTIPSKNCLVKNYPIILCPLCFFLFICCIILGEMDNNSAYYVIAILWLICSILWFITLFNHYYSINFILGQNYIVVEQIAFCRKKITNYQFGQLVKIELNCQFLDSVCCGGNYSYKIKITININGITSDILCFEDRDAKQIYTAEEIGYFNYIMNLHIRDKMMPQNYNQI